MTGAYYSLCIARKSKNLLIHIGGFSSTCSFLCEGNVFVTGFYENIKDDSQWRRAITQHNAKARIVDYCDTTDKLFYLKINQLFTGNTEFKKIMLKSKQFDQLERIIAL
jgi:hypothetical protein